MTFNSSSSRTRRTFLLYKTDNRKSIEQNSTDTVHQKLHHILSSLKPLLPSDDTIPEMFTPLPSTATILQPQQYKVAFQAVWLAHLRHPLEPTQLKALLLIIHKRVIPYMNKAQLLMDWLTDSYNSGTAQLNSIDVKVEVYLFSH